MPFPNKVPGGLIKLADERRESIEELKLTAWHTVAEVAEAYPKLLVWLAQGRVSGLRNVFGALVAVARLLPGVRAILWHLMFEKVADRAPWRPPCTKPFNRVTFAIRTGTPLVPTYPQTGSARRWTRGESVGSG